MPAVAPPGWPPRRWAPPCWRALPAGPRGEEIRPVPARPPAPPGLRVGDGRIDAWVRPRTNATGPAPLAPLHPPASQRAALAGNGSFHDSTWTRTPAGAGKAGSACESTTPPRSPLDRRGASLERAWAVSTQTRPQRGRLQPPDHPQGARLLDGRCHRLCPTTQPPAGCPPGGRRSVGAGCASRTPNDRTLNT